MTSLRFELTGPAERDLEEVFFEAKERHGRLVTERVYDDLPRTFALLADMPEMWRHRPVPWPAPYRFWPTGPAYIAYRSDVRPIRIVRIARASRDWSRFRSSLKARNRERGADRNSKGVLRGPRSPRYDQSPGELRLERP